MEAFCLPEDKAQLVVILTSLILVEEAILKSVHFSKLKLCQCLGKISNDTKGIKFQIGIVHVDTSIAAAP